MEFMEWVRGPMVGMGSFATVNLVKPVNLSTQFSSKMVVKSSIISNSDTLRIEKQVFSDIGHCQEIVRFLGDCVSNENGNKMYNLFFEYAEKGSLENQLKKIGEKFEECEVKKYTRSILKGLSHVHDRGYAHCDIKLSNILLFDNGNVKIADFGLAAKIEGKCEAKLKGTPLYMSPESIVGWEAKAPADVWALGCAVVTMISGKSAWDLALKSDVNSMIYRIGMGEECPKVPRHICLEGRDFIEKCFIRDPSKRWTARMLLDHPFVTGFDDEELETSVSPRDPFEFSGLDFVEESSLDRGYEFSNFKFVGDSSFNPFRDEYGFEFSEDCRSSAYDRIGEIGSDVIPDWSNSGSDWWIDVR